jgi:hypothetical protein
MTSRNDDLGGYDQTFQVRQFDINSQLHWLWEFEHLPDKVDEADSRGWSLRCCVKAPQVYLQADFPSQKNQRLLLELFLEDGKLAAPGGIHEIANWKVSFRTALAHEAVSHEHIRRHRRLPEDVRKRLLEHREDRFGIWHLYITLAHGGVRGNIDPNRSKLPPLGEEDLDVFATLLEQHLRKNLGHEHGMHLGFTPTLRPGIADEVAGGENWFRPTLVDYSITFEGSGNDDHSTLNYMMMTRQRPRPTGEGAGIIRASRPHFAFSRMRLAQSFFMEDTLCGRIHHDFPGTQLQRRSDLPIQWYWRIERHSRDHGRGPVGCPPNTLWPGSAFEAPMRFVQADTANHRTLGHSARVEFECLTHWRFVSDCPRDNTAVEMTVRGGIDIYITVVDGKLRIHPEGEKTSRRYGKGTELWIEECPNRGYYRDIFAGCVQKSAEKEFAAARTGIQNLKTAWTGLGVHVLPGAKHFSFKNAGAPMVDGFVNLAMEISYRSTDEE